MVRKTSGAVNPQSLNIVAAKQLPKNVKVSLFGVQNYYLIDTGTIISSALLSLLNKYLLSYQGTFMYLKDIIQGDKDNEKNICVDVSIQRCNRIF